MTPLGHAAASYLLGRAAWRWPMWGFLIGGVAPDLDFVLLPLDSFNNLHRTITHNVLFVAVIAAAGAACLVRRPARDRLLFAAAAVVAGLVHLLIDSVLDANGSNGVGVALLWPVSDRMFSPFNLLDPSLMPRGWHDPGDIAHLALISLAWELPIILAAAVLLIQALRQHRSPLPGATDFTTVFDPEAQTRREDTEDTEGRKK